MRRKWMCVLFAVVLFGQAVAGFAQDGSGGPSMRAIEFDSTVEGRLTVESPSEVYRFRAQAGDVIAITMTSTAVDSYLRLGDAQGNELLNDDDGALNLNARIGPIMIPNDTDLVVVATSFDFVVSGGSEVELGRYTLTLERVEPQPVEYDVEVEEELDADTPFRLFSFEAQRGDVLRIRMDSDDLDAYITVTPAFDIRAAPRVDDDSGNGVNALIVPFIAPETGTYFIVASNYRRGAEGTFELEVEPMLPEDIAIGDTVEGEIDGNNRALIYRFAGTAGDVINAVVESEGNLDTTMTILGPGGEQIAYNDDAGRGTRAPAITGLTLPADGAYTIVIAPFFQRGSGPVRLVLSEGRSSE